jgi:large subunit ribosomal protein L40e
MLIFAGGESSGAEILKSAAEKLSRLYWDNRSALDELVQAAVLEKFESELEAHRARAEYRTREDQYFKATGGQKDGAVKQVLIRTLLKGTITLLLKPSDSIAFVKLILQQKNEGVCLDQMRLILGGKQLEDERTLSEYDFEEESTIDLVLRLRGGMADFTTGAPDVLQGGGSQSTTRTVVSPTRQPSARIAGRVERARAAAPVAGVVAAQPQPRPRPDDFVAPTKEAIATMHVRLQELLEAMSERSSTGKQRSGRYLQADSARRHYIMHIGFRQLQVGVLPTATDLRMLFGPAPIKGTKEQPAMEKWIKERSGWREGHSNVTIGSTEEQTTMLQFYSTREDMVSDVATHRAPVGRPAKYKFDFGVFKGETLDRLLKPSVSVTGVGGAVTRGIDYVCGFIMGKEFVWRFPEHLKLYLELVSFEDRPLTSPTFKMVKPMGAGALSAFGSFMGQAFPGLAAVAASDDAAVDNGAPVAKNFYVFWSRAQSTNKHGAVYIESRILLALETTLIQVARIFGDDDGSLTIVIRDGKGVTQTVKLDATEPAYAACVNRRTHFDFSNANARVSFQSTRFSPALLVEIPLLESGSTSNTDFVEPAPLGTSSTNAGALQADTTLQEESITNVDFLNDARQRELADKAGDFLSSDQQGQYDSILAMFENGTLGKLSTLNSTTLKPRKLDSNSDEADYNLRDVTFWDPEEQFAGVVDATPCANKGWAHARHVKRHCWAKRPRRVTGKERDAFVAGRATTCSECKDVAKRLNSLIAALKSIGPLDLAQTKRLAELREERATCRYNQSTLSTNVINYFSERFPGQAATFPFVLTHRAAVTKGLAREITRSARTPQQPHDLESEISELRALAKEDRAIYYHANRLFQKRRGAACVLPLEYKEPEDMKVISDTWLADFIDAYAHSKDQYIRQWHEQMVLVDVAQILTL